ncbi:hypothetical protein Hanom_Chr10g00911761 [Helianthus anomalus]
MGPQISPWILSKNDGVSCINLVCEGRIISLPREHAAHDKSCGSKTFKFLRGCPVALLIIRLIIMLPG